MGFCLNYLFIAEIGELIQVTVNRIITRFSFLLILLALTNSCTDYEKLQFNFEKVSESVNGVLISVSLTGDAEIVCDGEIKYKDRTLKKFKLKSFDFANPFKLAIDYSDFPDLAVELATDFVLNHSPKLKVLITNKEKEFYKTSSISLQPKVPPIATGIKLRTKKIAARIPVGFSQALDDAQSYLDINDIIVDDYKLKQIATVALLIKNNSKILFSVVPADVVIPVYKDLMHIRASVLVDDVKHNPFLLLYPSLDNNYYEGPNLYQLAKKYYSDGETPKGFRIKPYKDKYILERDFETADLKGDYDLYLSVADDDNNFFFYNLGMLIFDNVAPRFEEWDFGEYNFGGNELYEGKVYLDYKVAGNRNPYDVIFSGKVFGDVKKIYVNFRRVEFKTNKDLLFTQKIYIYKGYKDIYIRLIDNVGNIGDYVLPVIAPE